GARIVEEQVRTDTHAQPYPPELPDLDDQIRLVCPAGGILMFAGAHLHSSVPNRSGRTRFSFDFRTVHQDDVRQARGAPNVDSSCAASQLRHYRRAADFAIFPGDLATEY